MLWQEENNKVSEFQFSMAFFLLDHEILSVHMKPVMHDTPLIPGDTLVLHFPSFAYKPEN